MLCVLVELGPGRGHHSSMNADGSKSQSFESMQQMRKVMEQEMKNGKYKANNKGFVFTLMPLYAIGVAVFAVYKFLKIKSQDETGAVKRETSKGTRKPEDTVELGPGRGHHSSMNADGSKSQSFESMQQMRKVMEQEMKNGKYKANNKGFVFTLMPLYAIGVAVFAVYKFLKIKSQDETGAVKRETSKGTRKPEDTENQLHELEQRLSQTEKMLNSILTQLDPLTNCVESVASEQKNEIMAQLQSIRQLMRKRGMNRPQLNTEGRMSCFFNIPFTCSTLENRQMSSNFE
ncbi:Coiled-coil domain-containing protein 107 [Acipenser ruthenus]|uniref:Coiled-coil domain-containing protein 107 n=1 Tax=Acipenser ruthenus TaxID=7906 RepID=A0A662YUV7_ACIRT|nr:Coiled-coil domain-containing protein 107 [Acipenser ruthenus]